MLFIRHRLFLFLLCCLCIFGCDDVRDGMLKVHITGGDNEVEVTGIPQELIDIYKAELSWLPQRQFEFELDRHLTYYTKYIDADGIAIVGNHYVRDEQFYVAREIILHMTSKHPEIREHLSLETNNRGFRVVLMNTEEPVDSEFNSEFGRRNGYVAAYPENQRFTHSGQSLRTHCVARIGWRGLQWDAETETWKPGRLTLGVGTLIHEFAHALASQQAITLIYPDFHEQLENAFLTDIPYDPDNPNPIAPFGENSAHTAGFGNKNMSEYWAELTRHWFVIHPNRLTLYYKEYKQDQLMLPIIEDIFPKIYLYPLNKLEQPIEWDWDPDLILD